MYSKMLLGLTTVAITMAAPLSHAADKPGAKTDAEVIAAIDTTYQAAVERNDWQAMDKILHADYALVLGDGTGATRQELIDESRGGDIVYEKQVEMPGTQTVRMYGKDTAIVTALLWLKYTRKSNGIPRDYKLWFSDVYVRTADGWKYAFGQASLKLP